MQNKITQALKSRTFWTIVAMFVVNGFAGIHNSIPSGLVMPIDAILGILASYFHVTPSQNYEG